MTWQGVMVPGWPEVREYINNNAYPMERFLKEGYAVGRNLRPRQPYP